LGIDASSLSALQIFKPEQHPSAHGLGGAKEGMSLFGILDTTQSPSGRSLLRYIKTLFFFAAELIGQSRKWMLRPMRDTLRITERLDCISFLSQPSSKEFLETTRKLLKRCSDLTTICGRIRTYQCSVTDWDHVFQVRTELFAVSPLTRHITDDFILPEDQTISSAIRVSYRLFCDPRCSFNSLFLAPGHLLVGLFVFFFCRS